MKTNLLRILPLAFGFLVPAQLPAQYTLDWFTVDGGGGSSGGGAYQLSGTAGQPDAGVLASDTYWLFGGYWSVTLEGPRLTIELLPDHRTIKISWPLWASDYVLEQRAALPDVPEEDWPDDLPPASYQTDECHYYILLPASGDSMFYRLHRPCPAP